MGSPRIIKDLTIDSVSFVTHPPHPSWTVNILSHERHPMLETTKYVRKPFLIDAVQVTAANMEEIAKWVAGDIRTDEENKQYVKVRVHRPANDRQTKAYVGDWVLYAGTGYKVYTPKAFEKSFEQASGETHFVDTSTETKTGAKRLVDNDEVEKVIEGNVVVPKRKKAS